MTRLMICLSILTWVPALAHAALQGPCSDCHTMHNSQDGQIMADFGGGTGPNPALTRGSCLGCHAQGGGQALVTVGTNQIPQVLHTEAVDLAGGNFAYITGAKGGGASESKGHNVTLLPGVDPDTANTGLPGGIIQSFHWGNSGTVVSSADLTCAGINGCHGYRYAASSFPDGISGAHHNNVGGKLDVADNSGNSYRFLPGVKGFEDDDWQYTRGGTDHNEYFALTEPIQLGCGTNLCHGVEPQGVVPPNGTISEYCALCHGNFHTLANGSSDGIGTAATSPFIRHPADLALPNDGEYSQITSYDLNAPVGRTGAIPNTASATASPTNGDAVTCLSCHVAHASDYPDLLRWDYDTACLTRTGNADCGCFTCHTAKDD